MDHHPSHQPDGLTKRQLRHLSDCTARASGSSVEQLRESALDHLAGTIEAHRQNALINVRLAKAICERVETVVAAWDDLTPNARFWLGGAIRYFVMSQDDESDHTSPIGFEDDAEVLNACLRLAGLPDLCLNIRGLRPCLTVWPLRRECGFAAGMPNGWSRGLTLPIASTGTTLCTASGPTIWSGVMNRSSSRSSTRIEPVDPRKVQLMPDNSSGYRLSKLFLEAQLRQMPATGFSPTSPGWAYSSR